MEFVVCSSFFIQDSALMDAGLDSLASVEFQNTLTKARETVAPRFTHGFRAMGPPCDLNRLCSLGCPLVKLRNGSWVEALHAF